VLSGTTTATTITSPAATALTIQSAGTTAVTINTAQKVGIGTTPSGSYILEVNGNPNFNSVGGVYLTCGTYDVIKNPSGNIIAFGGVTSSQWDTTALYTGGTERMRIDSSGNAMIGTTTSGGRLTVSTATGSYVTRFITEGNNQDYIAFVSGSNIVGSVSRVGGSNVAYNTSSDYRLKENVAPMTGALAKVAQLKPCSWTWKLDGSAGQGFIAHELAEVVPDAVTGEKDAVDAEGNPKYQGVDTSFLVATLTAAIQELKAEFDAYKASHP
jgi:hypothetical protein